MKSAWWREEGKERALVLVASSGLLTAHLSSACCEVSEGLTSFMTCFARQSDVTWMLMSRRGSSCDPLWQLRNLMSTQALKLQPLQCFLLES